VSSVSRNQFKLETTKKLLPQQISQFPAPTTETWKNFRIELYFRKNNTQRRPCFFATLGFSTDTPFSYEETMQEDTRDISSIDQ
jgi:hypothetical protein